MQADRPATRSPLYSHSKRACENRASEGEKARARVSRRKLQRPFATADGFASGREVSSAPAGRTLQETFCLPRHGLPVTITPPPLMVIALKSLISGCLQLSSDATSGWLGECKVRTIEQKFIRIDDAGGGTGLLVAMAGGRRGGSANSLPIGS
jgi:hypothetical protein